MKSYSLSAEHYESKFIIPIELVEPIIRYISIYCEIDPYSKGYKDGYYPINSLYFDSFNLRFLKKKLHNVSNRYNMRIRSYGYDPKPPYFFEIKQRNSYLMSKIRATVNNNNWPSMFDETSPGYIFNKKKIEDPGMKQFLMNLYLNHASPKILICYKRLAFESTVNEYARVTFDSELRYQVETEYAINRDEARLVYYGGFYPTAMEGKIILELKCRNDMPVWMMDLIRRFSLTRSAFSKYASGMLEALKINSLQNDAHELKSVYY